VTNSTIPTAAEALRLAYDVVKSPCSAAETERAKVLLGIATEIRQEQQFRRINEQRANVERRRAADKLAAAGIPAPESYGATYGGEPAYAGETAAARTQRLIIEAAGADDPTQTQQVPAYVPPTAWDSAVTQRVEVVWMIGDKAQCRHCHTPIELCPVAVEQQGEAPAVWRHKYTGQAACTVPALASVQGGDEVSHSFAEPEPRG